MEAAFPETEDGQEAMEGTAAHFVAMEPLLGRPVPAVGSTAPNGWLVDATMVKHGDEYGDVVRDEWERMGDPTDKRIWVETALSMATLIHPANVGHVDTGMASLIAKRITVIDFKYGHGFVDAYKNWQEIDYLAGMMEGLCLTFAEIADYTIRFVVVQPRCYHVEGTVRVWEVKGVDLWPLFQELIDAAYAALEPDAPTKTGPQCDDCRARHACTALLAVGNRAIDMAGASVPLELSNVALGAELGRLQTAKKRLEARIDGLAADAIARIDRGQTIVGYRKGFVDSREKFRDPAAAIPALALYGVDIREPDATITPPAARKVLEKLSRAAGLKGDALKAQMDIDATVIATYAYKPSGAAKLVPVDETAADKAFGAPTP